MTSTGKPWAGYIRVSTDEQEQSGLGLEAQEQRVRAMAVVKGVELSRVFVDSASAKTLERPELKAVLAGIANGEYAGLIISKLDRLTRSVRDLAELLEVFEKHGASLISCAETVDTSTAQGRMVLNITVTIAQWERETICERTRDALAAKKRRGELTGTAPYGARAVEGKLVPNPHEQLLLSTMRRLRLDGWTYTEIALSLNQSGYRTRAGGPWKYQYVINALKESGAK